MNAPDHFEDRLLAQLRQVVAEQPAPPAPTPHRPRRTRLILAGAGGAAALAAVAIVASSGDVTSRAYAVDSEPGGNVTVSIHSLSDAGGLQASLRGAGIPAVVDYVAPGEAGCVGAPPPPPKGDAIEGGSFQGSLKKVEPGGASEAGPSFSTQSGGAGKDRLFSGPPPGDRGGPKMKLGSKVTVTPDGATFTVNPEAIESGQKLYITTSSGTVSTIGMAISKTDPSAGC
jgi:hypothetical protein